MIHWGKIRHDVNRYDYEYDEDVFWAELTQYIPTGVLFFAYWTILEFKISQTVGKKVLNLKVTDIYGNRPSLKGVMVSSFGKSFLLPIDVILGWILTNDKRQRAFNKLGDTLIVKIKDPEDGSNLKYIKD